MNLEHMLMETGVTVQNQLHVLLKMNLKIVHQQILDCGSQVTHLMVVANILVGIFLFVHGNAIQ